MWFYQNSYRKTMFILLLSNIINIRSFAFGIQDIQFEANGCLRTDSPTLAFSQPYTLLQIQTDYHHINFALTFLLMCYRLCPRKKRSNRMIRCSGGGVPASFSKIN